MKNILSTGEKYLQFQVLAELLDLLITLSRHGSSHAQTLADRSSGDTNDSFTSFFFCWKKYQNMQMEKFSVTDSLYKLQLYYFQHQLLFHFQFYFVLFPSNLSSADGCTVDLPFRGYENKPIIKLDRNMSPCK